jgi:hypothetical protein
MEKLPITLLLSKIGFKLLSIVTLLGLQAANTLISVILVTIFNSVNGVYLIEKF